MQAEVNVVKKLFILLLLLMGLSLLFGCDQITGQMETISTQIDVESILTGILEKIDWEELKDYAGQGYDALTSKYPALKGENIRSFLKDNGLKLMNRYLESTEPETRENARKLGEIIKILYPDLTDEVDAVLQ